MDDRALATILLGVMASQISQITKHCGTSKEAWDKLDGFHQRRGKLTSKLTLFKRLLRLSSTETSGLQELVNA